MAREKNNKKRDIIEKKNRFDSIFNTEVKSETKEEIQNGKIPEEVKEEKQNIKVKISIDNLNIRKGPGKNYERIDGFTGKGIFEITEKKDGIGSPVGWGKLADGRGWISLYFCEEVK